MHYSLNLSKVGMQN